MRCCCFNVQLLWEADAGGYACIPGTPACCTPALTYFLRRVVHIEGTQLRRVAGRPGPAHTLRPAVMTGCKERGLAAAVFASHTTTANNTAYSANMLQHSSGAMKEGLRLSSYKDCIFAPCECTTGAALCRQQPASQGGDFPVPKHDAPEPLVASFAPRSCTAPIACWLLSWSCSFRASAETVPSPPALATTWRRELPSLPSRALSRPAWPRGSMMSWSGQQHMPRRSICQSAKALLDSRGQLAPTSSIVANYCCPSSDPAAVAVIAHLLCL